MLYYESFDLSSYYWGIEIHKHYYYYKCKNFECLAERQKYNCLACLASIMLVIVLMLTLNRQVKNYLLQFICACRRNQNQNVCQKTQVDSFFYTWTLFILAVTENFVKKFWFDVCFKSVKFCKKESDNPTNMSRIRPLLICRIQHIQLFLNNLTQVNFYGLMGYLTFVFSI